MKSKILFLNEKHIKIHFFGRNETAGRTDARTHGRTHGHERQKIPQIRVHFRPV